MYQNKKLFVQVFFFHDLFLFSGFWCGSKVHAGLSASRSPVHSSVPPSRRGRIHQEWRHADIKSHQQMDLFFLSLSQPAIQIPAAVFFSFFKQRRNIFVVITTTAMAHISSTINGLKVYSPFANCWMSSSQHFPPGFKICSPQLNPPSATVFVSI